MRWCQVHATNPKEARYFHEDLDRLVEQDPQVRCCQQKCCQGFGYSLVPVPDLQCWETAIAFWATRLSATLTIGYHRDKLVLWALDKQLARNTEMVIETRTNFIQQVLTRHANVLQTRKGWPNHTRIWKTAQRYYLSWRNNTPSSSSPGETPNLAGHSCNYFVFIIYRERYRYRCVHFITHTTLIVPAICEQLHNKCNAFAVQLQRL